MTIHQSTTALSTTRGYGFEAKRRNVRKAIVANRFITVPEVEVYLPRGYSAQVEGDSIVITGEDFAGWTLDGYVIPRLESGLIFAQEVAV